MHDLDEARQKLKDLQAVSERLIKGIESGTQRILLDKRTHRIRFEAESEESVTMVIEKKAGEDLLPSA
jgi:hypothetical protein